MTSRSVRASIATAVAVLVGLSATAAHASAYRYWSYWDGSAGTWTFSGAGPAFSIPSDGDVLGWTFGITSEDGSVEAQPATAPDFAAVCGAADPAPGSKRVALIIEPGDVRVAPEGETPFAPIATCVIAGDDDTGYDVVRSVVEVRTDNGLVCGLAGYPASECAPILDDTEVAALASQVMSDTGDAAGAPDSSGTASAAMAAEDSSGTPLATLAVAALLMAGAAVALIARRRQGRDTHA